MRTRLWSVICAMFAVTIMPRQAESQMMDVPESSGSLQPSSSAAYDPPRPIITTPSSRYTFPVLPTMVPAPIVVPSREPVGDAPSTERAFLTPQRTGVPVEGLLPVPVNPGNLLMPDHGEDPTLGFGYGVPLAGLASTGTRGVPASNGDIPTSGPVILLRTGIKANVNVLYDTGFQDGLSPAHIALRGTDASRQAGQFNLQSSSVDLTSDVQTPGTSFPVQGFFDGRLGSDGLQVRQVFGRVGNLLGGADWTTFADADMLPRTIVDEKAPAGAVYRTTVAQLQYMVPFLPDWAVGGVAIEQPVNDDFELNDPSDLNANNVRLHRYPDLVSRIRIPHPDHWGKSQVAVLVRAEGYEDMDYHEHFVTGWGVSGNTRFKTWGDDNIRAGMAGGQGFSRYLFGLETAQSAVFDNGRLRALPCFGTYISYQHLWRPFLWSNFAYGYGQTEAVPGKFVDAPQRVQSGWIDLVWSVNKNCSTGIEYSYGTKEAWSGSMGDNHQILFTLQIGTQAAPSSGGGTADASSSAANARAGSPAAPVPMSRPGYSMRM